MNSTKIWANLGVNNLERTTRFYEALGFTPNGKHPVTKDLTSFLIGKDNFVIHFFLKDVLEANMKVKIADAENAIEVMFTLSAASEEEVDNWANIVELAGGRLLSRPQKFGKTYYGFVFADPDGHTFNVLQM
ncbi:MULTISPECIES: VOC family protein [Sphingobacterium]|uniref:VOC family protein n=1 Tax=Sphingobacterium TaxID=28453 RepID=UPI0013DD0B74|nr:MULTISPECIES: VOC family protein [unclassified Sphingobacterium]